MRLSINKHPEAQISRPNPPPADIKRYVWLRLIGAPVLRRDDGKNTIYRPARGGRADVRMSFSLLTAIVDWMTKMDDVSPLPPTVQNEAKRSGMQPLPNPPRRRVPVQIGGRVSAVNQDSIKLLIKTKLRKMLTQSER